MLAEHLMKMVEKQPDAIAISDPAIGEISYHTLRDMLNTVCHNISVRFATENYIGLIADQSAYAIIIHIAIVLTGRVIIPIDPRFDPALIDQMLAPFTDVVISDCDDVVVGKQTVPITDLIFGIAAEYDFQSADTEAYILHTSGTTGRSKPVIAKQSALLIVAEELAVRYHFNEMSKVLQFAYLSFDSSLVEIWGTLLSGGCIVVPGIKIREDLYGTIEHLLIERKISAVTLPPSIVDNINADLLGNLNTLVIAGEELSLVLANKLVGSVAHLINAYGPTESIICATTFEIREKQFHRVPIGEPLPSMTIVQEDQGKNGEGEMLLASAYLASGYASDENLTNEKFKVGKDGSSYYKSGDIGRKREDGLWEFIGRIDNQVKLGGQRIEIEGVEACVREVSGNNNVTVIIVDDKIYCAYVAEKPMTIFEKIPTLLKGKLPEFAIPRSYIKVGELPLDFNGKVDRKRLTEQLADSISYKRKSRVENKTNNMIFLWSKALNIPIDDITSNSNFFALGGDSLAALKLLKLINDDYKLSIRLSELIIDPATPSRMEVTVGRYLV